MSRLCENIFGLSSDAEKVYLDFEKIEWNNNNKLINN